MLHTLVPPPVRADIDTDDDVEEGFGPGFTCSLLALLLQPVCLVTTWFHLVTEVRRPTGEASPMVTSMERA